MCFLWSGDWIVSLLSLPKRKKVDFSWVDLDVCLSCFEFWKNWLNFKKVNINILPFDLIQMPCFLSYNEYKQYGGRTKLWGGSDTSDTYSYVIDKLRYEA